MWLCGMYLVTINIIHLSSKAIGKTQGKVPLQVHLKYQTYLICMGVVATYVRKRSISITSWNLHAVCLCHHVSYLARAVSLSI